MEPEGINEVVGHWPLNALFWPQIGPPLRPVAADLRIYWAAVAEWSRRYGIPRVLLLGVTPELYRLPWPVGVDFLAVDHSQAMIDLVWPGPKDQARCADWLSLDLSEGSRDIVLCDGGLQLLTYPQGQQQLVRVLQKIVSARGICLLRLFVPPAPRESPAVVLADLLAGRIPNPNLLKLRLGMAMMDRIEDGVAVDAVWQVLCEATPDLEALALRIGWTTEQMLALTAYRGSPARFYFVTVEQALDLFCQRPGGFAVHATYRPHYELGEQCPIVVLRRAQASSPDVPRNRE
jgi:hypothetical protein